MGTMCVWPYCAKMTQNLVQKNIHREMRHAMSVTYADYYPVHYRARVEKSAC